MLIRHFTKTDSIWECLGISYSRYFVALDSPVGMNHTLLEANTLVFQYLFCNGYIIFISCCKLVLRNIKEERFLCMLLEQSSNRGKQQNWATGCCFYLKTRCILFCLSKRKCFHINTPTFGVFFSEKGSGLDLKKALMFSVLIISYLIFSFLFAHTWSELVRELSGSLIHWSDGYWV